MSRLIAGPLLKMFLCMVAGDGWEKVDEGKKTREISRGGRDFATRKVVLSAEVEPDQTRG